MVTLNLKKQPLIQINNVKKAFKQSDRQELLVLNEVNLELYSGEIVALLGKSGSGKSTLLRIIAGLTKPTDGEVVYAGEKGHISSGKVWLWCFKALLCYRG